jgi:hypothetical protein
MLTFVVREEPYISQNALGNQSNIENDRLLASWENIGHSWCNHEKLLKMHT